MITNNNALDWQKATVKVERIVMMEFLKECRTELRKVAWPAREEVLNSTIVVLIGVVIVSIFLFTSDSIFEKLFDALISLGVNSSSDSP